jgi:hypothetical protein
MFIGDLLVRISPRLSFSEVLAQPIAPMTCLSPVRFESGGELQTSRPMGQAPVLGADRSVSDLDRYGIGQGDAAEAAIPGHVP